ncbi:sigma-70 family RNA polymerase sigma factor [Streptomyces violascens]|uniref:sigma-70 family RNA polymerase sigma factor n=1 Tax=Streptomyces violascens TaxID=67381 RepID=UPI0037B590A7
MSKSCSPCHRYDDTPRTDEAFGRLAALPVGPERAALREELITAWLPLSRRLAGRYRNRGESAEDLKPGLHALPARERRVLYLRYFHGMAQKNIGRELGMSQMQVCRLLRQCCEQLRDEVMRPIADEAA